MSAQVKLSKVAQAYERCKEARKALMDLDTRVMETTEDKCGIVWERHLLARGPMGADAISVILMATPSWWDIYCPVSVSTKTADTIEALKALTR